MILFGIFQTFPFVHSNYFVFQIGLYQFSEPTYLFAGNQSVYSDSQGISKIYQITLIHVYGSEK